MDGWGFQSNFRVQPNNCVEVVLRCVVVEVVTINLDIPASRDAHVQCKVEDDATADLTDWDIHVVTSVVATDDRRGNIARGGDCEAVIDAVTYEGTICGGARY